LPFLIDDVTRRELRVPGGPATEHPNGALGIRRLQVATPDTEEAVRAFATFAGSPSGLGTSLRLGACQLSLVTPEEARRHLDTVGAEPFVVGLATDAAGGAEQLDRGLSQGVRIQLSEPAAGG